MSEQFNGLHMNLGNLSRLSHAQTRSISPENFTGEKGKGGMATEGTGANVARELGQGWKVSPSVDIPAHATHTMAGIDGMGRQAWDRGIFDRTVAENSLRYLDSALERTETNHVVSNFDELE